MKALELFRDGEAWLLRLEVWLLRLIVKKDLEILKKWGLLGYCVVDGPACYFA
jgi:hypothetical protein